MKTIQKNIGPDYKISIHESAAGNWELALIDGLRDDFFENQFVAPQFWAWSEDGLKRLYLDGQVFEDDDIIHCVRIDELPDLWGAARRYAFAMSMAKAKEQRDQPITVSRVRA